MYCTAVMESWRSLLRTSLSSCMDHLHQTADFGQQKKVTIHVLHTCSGQLTPPKRIKFSMYLITRVLSEMMLLQHDNRGKSSPWSWSHLPCQPQCRCRIENWLIAWYLCLRKCKVGTRWAWPCFCRPCSSLILPPENVQAIGSALQLHINMRWTRTYLNPLLAQRNEKKRFRPYVLPVCNLNHDVEFAHFAQVSPVHAV